MADNNDAQYEQTEWDGPSKSALKRQMLALQKLGETLVGLSEKQLAKVPIEDERLMEVISEARGMRSHGAPRRPPSWHPEAWGALDRKSVV